MNPYSEIVLKKNLSDILAHLKVHNWIMSGDREESDRDICVKKLSPLLMEGRTIEELENELLNITVYGSREEADAMLLKIRGHR